MQYEYVMPQMIIDTLWPEKKVILKEKVLQRNDFNLAVKIENLYEAITEYFKEEKKIKKIRNERVVNERLKLLAKEKDEIKATIEEMVKQTNSAIAEGRLEKELFNAVYEFILQFARKVMGGQRTFSTLRKWHYTKEKVKAFCWYHYEKTVFLLKEIPFSFAENFYDYLTLVDNCGNNLAMKYVKNIKQVFDRTVTNAWNIKNPIHGYKCNYIDPERDPLVMEDILKLINTDLDDKLNTIRDAYLFSILRALRMKMQEAWKNKIFLQG